MTRYQLVSARRAGWEPLWSRVVFGDWRNPYPHIAAWQKLMPWAR